MGLAIRVIISRRLGTKCVKTKYKNWVMVDIGQTKGCTLRCGITVVIVRGYLS